MDIEYDDLRPGISADEQQTGGPRLIQMIVGVLLVVAGVVMLVIPGPGLVAIMVGLNQTVMFSLFMVIIAAFIGTQDLGQEMQRALSSTDVGKGLVLGLCVAFMGLMVDHLILQWSADRKKALGID